MDHRSQHSGGWRIEALMLASKERRAGDGESAGMNCGGALKEQLLCEFTQERPEFQGDTIERLVSIVEEVLSFHSQLIGLTQHE
jgi:hypothetical protein